MQIVDAPAAPAERTHAARRNVRYWLVAIVAVAAIFTLVQRLTTLSRPLNYSHAWVSADFALQARSFSHSGVIALRGVPFSNNPPYGIRPEPYLHWPPLFPILLSFVFRIFGESEASMHGFMLLIQIATAALIYLLVCNYLGTVAGLFGVLAWLSRIVVLKYANAVFQLNLAILFIVLSILFFRLAAEAPRHRLWTAIAAGSIFCAVLSSWEAVLAPIGLLAGSLWLRDRAQRRIAIVMLASGAAAAVCVLAWYAFIWPDLAWDNVNTLLYRAGLGDLHSTSLFGLDQRASYPWLPVTQRVVAIGQLLLGGLGGLSLLAIAAYVCTHLERSGESGGNSSTTVFAGLLAPPVIWFTVFSNHAANHEYQYLLIAPVAAFAIAWCADAALRHLAVNPPGRTRVRMWAVAVAGPLLLLLPIVTDAISACTTRSAIMAADSLVEFGRAIRAATPPGAVVLTPEVNEVPIYYSQRHLIAGVASDEDTRRVLPLVKANFPNSPLYLAIYREGRAVILKVTR